MGALMSSRQMGHRVVNLGSHAVVVPLDAQHEEDEQRHHHSGDPRALCELGDEDDDDGDAGGKGAQAVARACGRTAPLPPFRFQCTTMPACDSVNARKAPMA